MLRHISNTRSPSLLPTARRRFRCCPCSSSAILAANRTSRRIFLLQQQQQQLSSVVRWRVNFFSNAAAIEEEEDDTEGNILDHGAGDNNNDKNGGSRTKQLMLNDYEQYLNKIMLWFNKNNNNDHSLTSKNLRSAFFFEQMQNPPRSEIDVPTLDKARSVTQWWTAVFVNPISHDRFPAIALSNVPFLQIDGKYYYTKKKHSAIAATVHFLQENNVTFPREESEELSTSNLSPFRDSKDGFSPRSRLQRQYETYSILRTNNNFFPVHHLFYGEGEEGKDGNWWTASFQCPLTLQRYMAADLMEITADAKMEHAGRIWYKTKNNAIHAASTTALQLIDWSAFSINNQDSKDLSAISLDDQQFAELEAILQPILHWYKQEHGLDINATEMETNFVATQMSSPDRWTASFICPVTGERFDAGKVNAVLSYMVDQVMWYDQKHLALEAAALSAYDILHYRKTGQSSPRFCNEDPATLSTPLKVSDTGSKHQNYSIDESIDNISSQGTGDHGHDQEVDNEDEYVIQLIPQQTGFGQHHRSSTLDIIAQTWIESTTSLSKEDDGDKRINNFEISMHRRQEAMNRAMTWLKEHEIKPKIQSSGNRTLLDRGGRRIEWNVANVILASLAETHQRIPFDSQPVGVEKVATAILKCMTASEQYTPPHADTFAYYIKCLEGETTEDIAQRADEIVSAMERGRDNDERPLPMPNALVYDSLLQVKAMTGSFAQLSHHLDNTAHPTRATFLAGLSAMAHDTTNFNVDLAMQCVSRMTKLADEFSDSTLQPDTEVFDAPLRWSGGALWARRFSRAIPWDSYSDIFSGGVLLDDDSSTEPVQDQVREMERWLGYLEAQGHSPSIETFESIIQAWVRCGTKYGLHQAEQYCERLIHGEIPGVNPRLQTFYPILAGWAYSGSTESLENVDKWLLKIQELFTDLHLQRRFVSLPFLSLLATQKQLLSRADKKESQELMYEAKLVAWTCSHTHLLALIDDFKAASSSFFIPNDVFLLTAHAWYNVASAAKSMDDLMQAFDGIQKNVDVYEALVVWLYNSNTEQTRYQLAHLLEHAPSIYSAHLSALEEFIRISNQEDSRRDATCHLLAIEEKIRRSREILQFLKMSGDALDRKIDHGYSEVFPFKSVLRASPCKNWADYRSKAIEILDALVDASSLHQPDMIRLCVEMAHMKDSSSATQQVLGFLTVLLNRGWAETDRETILQTLKILERGAGDEDKERRLSSNGDGSSKEDTTLDDKGRLDKEQSVVPCFFGKTHLPLRNKKPASRMSGRY
jgi:hypothetical protein